LISKRETRPKVVSQLKRVFFEDAQAAAVQSIDLERQVCGFGVGMRSALTATVPETCGTQIELLKRAFPTSNCRRNGANYEFSASSANRRTREGVLQDVYAIEK